MPMPSGLSGFLKKAIDTVRDKAGSQTVVAGYVAADKVTVNVSRTGDFKNDGVSCKVIAEQLAERLNASGGGKDQFGFCGMKRDDSFDEAALRQTIIDVVRKTCA